MGSSTMRLLPRVSPIHWIGPVLISLVWLTAACSQSDGPEFAAGETLQFNGILTTETLSRHDFGLTNSGTVDIELQRVSLADPETREPFESPGATVAIGRPADAGCQVTLSKFLLEGESYAVRLETTTYCLVVSRGLGVPADTILTYSVVIAPAFS